MDSEREELLQFLLGEMQMHSPSMDGQHSYRMRTSGWPWTHCKGPNAVEAIKNAIADVKREQEAMDKLTNPSPRDPQ